MTTRAYIPATLKASLRVLGRLRTALARISAVQRPPAAALDELTAILTEFEPMLAGSLRNAVLANYLSGARRIANAAIPRLSGPPMPPDPRIMTAFGDSDGISLPLITEAVQSLRSRRLMTPETFATADQDARRTAFTIARVQSMETIAKVRDALARDVETGGTLRQFRRQMQGVIDDVTTGPQIETLYRTQLAQAYSSGKQEVMSHPMVQDEFPYLLWVATHDTRVRVDHLAMEKHGQNGTAVYRADDPMWRMLYPPAGYNCRCDVVPLSIADAAHHGSREAQRWLASGVRPEQPEFAVRPYPLRLPRGWPVPGRIGSVA